MKTRKIYYLFSDSKNFVLFYFFLFIPKTVFLKNLTFSDFIKIQSENSDGVKPPEAFTSIQTGPVSAMRKSVGSIGLPI